MSAKRAPSPPPLIPGFEHVSLIGSGGFSDVFLYEQKRPRRRVAVKVLLHEWSNPAQRAAFDGEADLMARLSTHPSIVTIYEADVAPDGRPYLAMEFCSRPSLGTRYRTERLGLAECLRVVVQIAGAVETAHRAGILHRDIKPANILGTDYGHPVLTDFGISSTLDDVARAEGLSIPWSPPESFEDPPRAGIGTDVWALGATLYTFLAGRSPFEVPGGSNSSADLVQRICGRPLAPTGRSDVPASLENVLATSMAKDPSARYRSVLDFARALQQVQIELAHGITPIDIFGDTGVVQHAVERDEDDDEPGTRLRGVVSIDPSGGPAVGQRGASARPEIAPQPPVPSWDPGTPRTYAPAPMAVPGVAVPAVPPTFVAAPPRPVAPAPAPPSRVALVDPTGPAPRDRAGAAPARAALATPQAGSSTAHLASHQVPLEDTVLRPDAFGEPAADEDRAEGGGGPRRLVAGLVAGVVVLALAAGGTYLLTRPGSSGAPQTHATSDQGAGQGTDGGDGPSDNIGGIVPPVEDLKATVDKAAHKATFRWKLSHRQDGDTFGWGVIDPLKDDPSLTQTSETSVTVPLGADGDVCVVVVVDRDGQSSAVPQRACALKH